MCTFFSISCRIRFFFWVVFGVVFVVCSAHLCKITLFCSVYCVGTQHARCQLVDKLDKSVRRRSFENTSMVRGGTNAQIGRAIDIKQLETALRAKYSKALAHKVKRTRWYARLAI
jgi:hypothetical protein